MNVLVGGFEPWDAIAENPSGELARAAGGIVLPVDWTRAWSMLRAALRRRKPDALILLGLSERRDGIHLERLAMNLDYHASGRRARNAPIEPGQPWIREGSLPWDRILSSWEAAGLPGKLSHHAGTFLCNHVYYRALGAFGGPCGFIHLPPLRKVGRVRQRKALELAIAAVTGATPSARPPGSSPGS